MFFGYKSKRKSKSKEIEDRVLIELPLNNSNLYFEQYYTIAFERKILKKYFLAFIFLIKFLKEIFLKFYIFLYIYIFNYFFFDYKFLIFLIFFFFFFNNKFIIKIIYLFYLFFYLFLKFIFFLFFQDKELLKMNFFFFKLFLQEYIYIYLFNNIKLYFLKLQIIIQYFILKFLLFIFFLQFFFNFFIVLVTIIIFNVFCNINNLSFLNNFIYLLRWKIFIYLFILKKKNNNFLYTYIKLKVKKVFNKIFLISLNLFLFLKFLLELIFFFNKTSVFHDYYIFLVWDDIRDEEYMYTHWKVKYRFIQYYAERRYFGLSGYYYWLIHILKYEIFVPFSYIIHKLEWKWELLEIRIFTKIEYTEFEKTLFSFLKYFSFFFFRENRIINRKNLFYDFFDFLLFFLIEDLFLYYFQFYLFINYNLKYIFIFFNRCINSFLKIFNYISIRKLKKKNIFFEYFFFNFFYKLNLYIFIYLKFFKIYLFFFILKLIKIIVNFLKIRKFIINFKLILKNNYYFLKLRLFLFFILIKILNFIILKNNLNNIYYNITSVKILKIFKLYYKKTNKFFKVEDILLKNYKNECYYLNFKRFYSLNKNIMNILIVINEKKFIYKFFKNVLSSYTNLKRVDQLTWYDRLIGRNAGYIWTYKLYSNYLHIKYLKRKKYFNKFKIKKDNYYYFIIKKSSK